MKKMTIHIQSAMLPRMSKKCIFINLILTRSGEGIQFHSKTYCHCLACLFYLVILSLEMGKGFTSFRPCHSCGSHFYLSDISFFKRHVNLSIIQI